MLGSTSILTIFFFQKYNQMLYKILILMNYLLNLK